jgi:hypothetical protein
MEFAPQLPQLPNADGRIGDVPIRDGRIPSEVAHKNITTPFARCVTPELKQMACRLSAEEARARLGAWYKGNGDPIH